MNDQAIRFRIGIFVLAALIALGVLVILFGGRPYYFLPSTTYTVQFDDAQGIAAGTPVKRSGVKIGEVRRVTLDDDTGKVEVLIQVDHGFTLRKSDRATLIQTIIGGDATIAFLPPPNRKDIDTTVVEAGAVLEGFRQATPTDVIHPAEDALKEIKKSLEKLTPAAEGALRKIDSAFDKVDKMAPGVEKAVEEIRDMAKKLTPGAEKALERIDKLAPVVEKAFEKIDKLAPVMERAFDKIDKMAPGVEKAVDEIREMVKKIDKIAPGVEKGIDEIREVVKKFDKIVPSVEKGVDELRDMVKRLTPAAEKTLDKAEKALDKVDKLATSVQKVVENVDKNLLPDLRKTTDEIQVLARNWNKVGERLDLFIRTNEDKFVKIIEKADDTLKRVNEIFSDENQKNIRDTIKNVRASSDRFDAIAKNAEEFLKDSRSTLKTFNESLVKVDRVLTDIQKVTKPLAERSDSILKNVDESSDKINRTLTDVRELLQSVTRGQGTLQKLLYDPSLYNNLNEASLSLSRIMPRMDHIVHDVEIFADKLARHPELLGIRGAVAPGMGLKEPPSSYKVFPTYP